jgi:hypothetical protein
MKLKVLPEAAMVPFEAEKPRTRRLQGRGPLVPVKK